MLFFFLILNITSGIAVGQTNEIEIFQEVKNQEEMIDNIIEKQQDDKSNDDSYFGPDYLNELEKSNSSNITTKIYKSNETNADYMEDESGLNPTIESDLLNKDELIRDGGKVEKNKLINRQKMTSTPKESYGGVKKGNVSLTPWIVSFVLVVLLCIIFKFTLRK